MFKLGTWSSEMATLPNAPTYHPQSKYFIVKMNRRTLTEHESSFKKFLEWTTTDFEFTEKIHTRQMFYWKSYLTEFLRVMFDMWSKWKDEKPWFVFTALSQQVVYLMNWLYGSQSVGCLCTIPLILWVALIRVCLHVASSSAIQSSDYCTPPTISCHTASMLITPQPWSAYTPSVSMSFSSHYLSQSLQSSCGLKYSHSEYYKPHLELERWAVFDSIKLRTICSFIALKFRHLY